MGWAFRFFGTFTVIIYLLLNYYVGLRILQALKGFFPGIKPVVFWPVFIVLSFSFIIDRLFPWHFAFLKVIGAYWVAVFLYLLIFFAIVDFLGFINWAVKIFPSWQVYWQNKKIFILPMLLSLFFVAAGSIIAHIPTVSKYELEIAKNTGDLKELKAVMVSDLHLEQSISSAHLEKAAEQITALRPDFIFLAGDLVEGTLDPATEEKFIRLLGKLKAKHGIYAVLGNHEHYGNEAGNIADFLKDQGIILLRDEVAEVLDGKIYIAGRNDYSSGRVLAGPRKSLADLLEGLDMSKPVILLDHQPQTVEETQQAGVDLMLSGHTHGGQLFPVQFFTKALFVIDRGLWQNGSFNLIVSTGLGTWGPPIRTSARSEIVEIDLHFK